MIGIAFYDQEHQFRKPLLYPAELPGRRFWISGLTRHEQDAQKSGFAAKDLHHLFAPFHLAEEMGKGLG
jgi:hypothetical protein